MKKDWEYKTIKEIGTVIGGTTPSTNNKEYWDGEHCWISPAELDGSHYLYDSVRKVTDKAVKDKNLKLLPIGTVILSSRAPIGKVTINKIPTYCNQGFKCVICGNRVYNEFLYWWFWGKTEYLNSIGTGATFKEISKKVVENIIIPVPPLSEQKEIVEYLDSSFAKIDKLKENAAKNLEEAKALFQSALKNALEPKEGWEYCEFSKVVDSLRTGLNPRVHFKLNTEDAQGYYVTVRELKGFTFEIDSKTDRINDAAIKRINERSNLQIGDVLFSGTGTIGRTALVEEEPTWWNIKEGVYAITPNKNRLESKFLIYLFKSDLILNKIYSKASGATIRSIPMKELNKIVLPIPPLSEQQSIVSFLDSLNEKLNTLQQNYSRICDECDALKQAILRQVFE